MSIFLLGDSIRLHAEPYIRAALMPRAIISPAENCRSSDILATHIIQWAPVKPGDIVHINSGLHDIRYNPNTEKPVNSLESYQTNLSYIFNYLTIHQAHVIWASSTPFAETVHNSVKVSRRYYSDIIKYNTAATVLAQSYGFTIHNLHAILLANRFESLLLPDGLHYNETGNRIIGQAIARAISELISTINAS